MSYALISMIADVDEVWNWQRHYTYNQTIGMLVCKSIDVSVIKFAVEMSGNISKAKTC
jgi:hypothetical protein